MRGRRSVLRPRGRGWALWKMLSGLADATDGGDDQEAARLRLVLGELSHEYVETRSRLT